MSLIAILESAQAVGLRDEHIDEQPFILSPFFYWLGGHFFIQLLVIEESGVHHGKWQVVIRADVVR